MLTQNQTDKPTIQAPPDREAVYEALKSKLVREFCSYTNLPAIITPEWIQQFVDSCEDYEAALSRWKQTKLLSQGFGKLYRNETFASFKASNDDQKYVLAEVMRISERLHDPEMQQRNLIFHGPCGTGKDHLMYCLMMQAMFMHGYQVEWFNGSDLSGQMLAAINEGRVEQKVQKLKQAQILAISDPTLKSEKSEKALLFLMEQWGRVVEYRYRHCLPIWLTVNVENERTDFIEQFGERIAGRLRQQGTSIYFNKQDYRFNEGNNNDDK